MRFDGDRHAARTTDPNGDYTIESLEPGEKTFIFSPQRLHRAAEDGDVAGGKDTRLDVQLSTGMRATGLVVTDGGAPVADATVRAVSASEMDGGRDGAHRRQRRIHDRRPGPRPLHVHCVEDRLRRGHVRDVDIATSGPVRIILKNGGMITGHVNGLTAHGARTDHGLCERPAAAADRWAAAHSRPSTAAAISASKERRRGTVRVAARTGAMFGGIEQVRRAEDGGAGAGRHGAGGHRVQIEHGHPRPRHAQRRRRRRTRR